MKNFRQTSPFHEFFKNISTFVKAFPALVRTPVPKNFTNPPSVNTFLTTPNVPYITIRTNSLSSLELAFHFISPPWKRLSSNLWILFSANKKNSFTPWRSPQPLELPLVDFTNVSTRTKLHLQHMKTRLFLSPKPFLIGHCFNQWHLLFLYINQLGSISTSFRRHPLKSVRRKALGWISYFTPSSSSVPTNVFSNLYVLDPLSLHKVCEKGYVFAKKKPQSVITTALH